MLVFAKIDRVKQACPISILLNSQYLDFNFKMEAGKALISSHFEKVEQQYPTDYDHAPPVTHQKASRKLKRDCLHEKKKVKNQQREESKVDNLNTVNLSAKCKSDEDHSVTTQESDLQKSRIASINLVQKDVFSLEKLISKPPYLTIAQTNRFIGDVGHATAIFKRPIIQGAFYLEFTVKEQIKKDKKLQNKSAVRLGIVQYTYNPSFPIGCGESLAYKSTDGGLVTDSNKFDQKQSYGIGDVIGVCIKIDSPKKFPNPKEISQGSSISFYKNGKLIFQYNKLKQIFYCFAISLYNFSQVQVNLNSQSKYPMLQGAKPYFTVLNENIPYKNLQEQRIFKI